MTDQNPIGVPQWSIDFWNEKRKKIDEIIKGLKEMSIGLGAGNYPDYVTHKELDEHIEKLERFKEEEL